MHRITSFIAPMLLLVTLPFVAGCVEDYAVPESGAAPLISGLSSDFVPGASPTAAVQEAASPPPVPTSTPGLEVALGSLAGPMVGATPSWTPLATSAPEAMATMAATPYPTATAPPTATADPFAQLGTPARLEIPAIGVDSFVEHVGLTRDRAMDVPKQWMNVGWYRDGYYPGEAGNAVIAGHLDSNTGGPAVFWDLHRLQPGDEVHVTYQNGDRYTFVVQGQDMYSYDAQGPIIESIFGRSLTSNLNLITCDGAWNRGQATYTHRLVVFTTLAPERTVRNGIGRDLIE